MSNVVHGGAQAEELVAFGLRPEDVLDLSANLHPAGPDARVLAAARDARLDRYPPPDAAPLREAIARAHGLDPTSVLPTAGGTAAIHLVARRFLRPEDECLVFPPTFGEYASAARLAGATVHELRCLPPSFEIDEAALRPVRLTFLCVPDNPTGRDLSRADVERIASRVRGTLVLDAAYGAFANREPFADALVASGANVVVIHSMTKLHAIPGLRLGYIVARPAVIERLAAAQPAWSIDSPALAAGIVAATQYEERRSALASMRRSRDELRLTLEHGGLVVGPGTANFLLVQVGDAARVRAALLLRHIVVRDCTSFGLPDWVRVAVPAAEQTSRLAAAMLDAVESP